MRLLELWKRCENGQRIRMVCLIPYTFAEEVSKSSYQCSFTHCLYISKFSICYFPVFSLTDFQYKKTRLEANELIKKTTEKLEEGGLLYIATDEVSESSHQCSLVLF